MIRTTFCSGDVLARPWRPWGRSTLAGMIWKTTGSVVALGGIRTAETAARAPAWIRTGFCSGDVLAAAVAAVGTLGRGRDDLEDGRQRRRPGRDPDGRGSYQSAGVDPDRLLQR